VDGVPVCPPPTPFYEPLCGDRGPYPGPPQPHPAGHSPWTTPHGGGRGGPNDSPPGGGGGGDAILGTRSPVGPPGTVSGPAPDTRQHPWPPLLCPPYGDGSHPLAPAGAPPRSGAAIAGEDRGSTRAPHWAARRLALLARRPHSGGPAPLALGLREGDPFSRGNCDGPSHGPHTPGTRFPEICPTNAYFKLFRWRPPCDHLVAHQPQPQSQYFPGIRNPPERAPT